MFWLRVEIESIQPRNEKELNGERYFSFTEPLANSCLEAEVYGDNVVFEGDIGEDNTVEVPVKEKDEKTLGMVEAYEKILLGKKITIE